MVIHFAADHAGFELKNVLIAYVRDVLGHEVKDWGAATYDAEDDYPDMVGPAAAAVAAAAASGRDERAIILGGSGQGEAMCANRFRGVRATVYYGGPQEIITLSRTHNDANVLSLGARFIDEATATAVVTTWLTTAPELAERHQRRITKLDHLLT